MAMTGGTAKRVRSVHPNYGNDTRWLINLYVYYKTSQDISNNKSTVSVGMYVQVTDNEYNVLGSAYDIGAWTDYYGSYVGTTTSTFNGDIPNMYGTRWLAENKTFTVNHNSDGTATATIYWKWGVNSPWGQYEYPSGSFTITLPTIPRASSITSAAKTEIGSAVSVKWTPASSSFKYKLKFTLGSYDSGWTAYVSPSQTSAYTYTGFTIPSSVSNQLTSATSGNMTVYLATYNSSGTQIGSTASKDFTVTVPSGTKPTIGSVTATIVNTNTTINGWGVAVAGYSKVRVKATASGAGGSTISSFTISGGYSTTQNGSSLDYTGGVISTSGAISFSVTAKDSRSRTSAAQNSSDVTFYAYKVPEVTSFTAQRSSSNSSQMVVKANWTFSSIGGHNSATATLKYKKSSTSSWTTYGTIAKNTNVTLTGVNFDETSSYNFQVIVTDSLSKTAKEEAFVSTIGVLIDLRAGGKGLGIGKIAESDTMEVALDSVFIGNVYIKVGASNISLKTYIKGVMDGTY